MSTTQDVQGIQHPNDHSYGMAIPNVNQPSLGPILSPPTMPPTLNQSLGHVSVMNIPGIQQTPMPPLPSAIPSSLNNPTPQVPPNSLGNTLGNSLGMMPNQNILVNQMPPAEDAASKARKKMRLLSADELEIVTRMWIEGISTESASRIMRVTIRTIQRIYKQLNEQCEKQQRGPQMHENLPQLSGEIEAEPQEEEQQKFDFQIPRRKRGRSKKDMSKVDSIIRDIEAQNSSLFGREIQDMLKEKHNIKMALTAVYDRLHAVRKQSGKEDGGPSPVHTHTSSSSSSSSSSSTMSSAQGVISLNPAGTGASAMGAGPDMMVAPMPGNVSQLPTGEYDMASLSLGAGLSGNIPMVSMGGMAQSGMVLNAGLNMGTGNLNMNGNPLMSAQLPLPSHVKTHGAMSTGMSTGMGAAGMNASLGGVSSNGLNTSLSAMNANMNTSLQLPNIVPGQLSLLDPTSSSNSNVNVNVNASNTALSTAQLMNAGNIPVHMSIMGPHVHALQMQNPHSHMMLPHHMMMPNMGQQQHAKKE